MVLKDRKRKMYRETRELKTIGKIKTKCIWATMIDSKSCPTMISITDHGNNHNR